MSKLNKKLPKPSDFCWMDSKRANRATSRTMPFGGTIPGGNSYFGWKQNSFSYSYQPQYRVRARLKPSKQLSTGSSISTTAWKWVNSSWKTDPAKPDTRNGGVTVDKKNRYYRYSNFNGLSLMTKGSYDRLYLDFRVRSYNPKAKQHGTWETKTLTINCAPNVTVQKIVALADGGMNLHVNTHGWTRGGSKITIGSIKRNGVELMKKAHTEDVDAIGEEQAADYPYADFGGDCLNGDLQPRDSITLKGCYFKTCDGVSVSIDGTYTVDAVSAVLDPPTLSVTRDEDTGTVTAVFGKSDTADDWDSVAGWMTCTVNGKDVRFDPVQSSGTGEQARTYKFLPPFDVALTLNFSAKNNLSGKISKKYTQADNANLAPIKSKGRTMVTYTDGSDSQPKNGMFNGSKHAAMVYETDFSTDAVRSMETETPFGRKRPVAFFGDGIDNTISVSGSVGVDADFAPVPFSSYRDWMAFQEQQGLVLLRMPDGEWYHAACTKCTIKNDDEYGETKTVDLAFTEVDV